MSWMDLLALTPQLILVLGATTLLLGGAWFPAPRPLLAGAILVALLAALAAGTVPPPVPEISALFHATPYARFFTVLWCLLGACGLLISVRFVMDHRLPAAEYVSLILFAVTGMTLLSAASSLIGLFLGLEAFTLAFYILIACRRDCDLSAEAALKYLILGAVATGFLAFGIALVYAASGSLHIPEALQGLQSAGGMRAWGFLGWGLVLCAVGFKISLAPFHLWTADVYQGTPAPVAALLATGSKGAVIAAVVGMMMSGAPLWRDMSSLLWVLAGLTMLAGALGALPQTNIKRLLAYSSVVHMGTVLVGLLPESRAGLTATVFALVVYVLASLGCFSVLASLADQRGEPQDFADWRGMGRRYPVRCSALALLLLSLAGLPGTAGFMAKFAIFHAAIQADLIGLALLGILASLISFAFYLKLIMLFFMDEDSTSARSSGSVFEHAVLAVCTSAVLLFGFFPAPLFNLIDLLFP